ncbi:MAG: glycosyltransferase family 2 protein, partial [Gammaproteobacteria bacterium]|nr:glycosyltransferase family 2 protein [Gammaproteobacteria bacterium]
MILSIVVPMYNEAPGLGEFFARTEKALREVGGDYEIVCVNDGSRDDTLARLLERHRRDPRIKVVNLSRNFGKEHALCAGLSLCRGQAAIPMDADLQDPPELIPRLVEKWREGYDIVYCVRVSRTGESWAKRLTAHLFWRFYSRMADVSVPGNVGAFRLMSRRVVEAVNRLPEKQRFVRSLFDYVGYPAARVEYQRPPRVAGETKWRYWRLWNLALDGIAASSTLPLRVWSYFGLVISGSAFCYAAFLVVRRLALGTDVPGYASLMVTILFLGGVQLITLGVLGEYLGRVFHEV